MNWINIVFNVPLFLATAAIAVLTYLLHRATQMQFAASLTVAFQNEWHSRLATLMRDYLHSEAFRVVLKGAIRDAYGTPIDYCDISRLLDRAELKGGDTDRERLEKFESSLRTATYADPLGSGQALFSGYEAVYQVLLSFDRVAVHRDVPLMMERCIMRYKPPIRDLSPVLQAFIAVRILLRPPKHKNYKKDYMLLLAKVGLEHPVLFKKCQQGLTERDELTGEEQRELRTYPKTS